jgi:hypothetical protein
MNQVTFRPLLKALWLGLRLILTAFVGLYGFFMLLARIDTPKEFQWVIFVDLLIGPFSGLLLYLWFHVKLLNRGRRFAVAVYVVAAVLISLCFLALHYSQVISRLHQSRPH